MKSAIAAFAMMTLAVTTSVGCATQSADVDEDPASVASDTQALLLGIKGMTFEFEVDTTYKRLVATGEFKGVDGTKRRFRYYKALGKDRGLVLFLNGRMEFIEKYDALFTAKNEYPGGAPRSDRTLADLPFSFLTLDQYGQGASKEGTLPGHVDDYATFVGDAEKLVKPFLQATRPKTFVVMGHSMGGLVATRFAERNADKIDGLVLSSPLFGVQAPPGVDPSQLQSLVMAYATPAPYGFGMADRCSTALPPTVLGGIAQCLSNAGCRSCFEAPVADPNAIPACSGIFDAATWSALRSGWSFLNSPASIGCQVNPDLEAVKAGCVLGPSFNGLTTDQAYCEWYQTHPLRGPSQTFGWISASYAAIGAANVDHAKLTMPTLLLRSTIDPVANPAAMEAFCGAAPDCTLKSYGPPVTSELWFHELLAESKRELAIGEIRDFLEARIGK